MQVDVNAVILQAVAEEHRGVLPLKLRDDDRADVEAAVAEFIDEPEHIDVISDAEVAADLVFDDVFGADGNDDLGLVVQLHEHAELGVRLKARQHARGVVVVKELAAEFQIQLAAELADPLADVFGLRLQIHVVAETDCCHMPLR